MDEIDKRLIESLGENARISLADLSRRMGLARTTVQSRMERLENAGTIKGYTIRMGHAHRPTIRASVLISFEPQKAAEVLAKLRSVPQVRRVHTTSGRFDMLVEIAAQNTAELDNILEEIGATKGIRSSESLIYLTTKIDRGEIL